MTRNRDRLWQLVQASVSYRAVSNVSIDDKWSTVRFRPMDNAQTNDRVPDIRQTELLDAPIHKVWDAVATSEGIAAWFMPNTFQPVLGHAFILQAGPFGDSPCKVTELDPPHRLSFTWGKDWNVSFILAERGDKTEFTLIHSGWDAAKVTEFGETHPVVRDRMAQGWGGLLRSLADKVRV